MMLANPLPQLVRFLDSLESVTTIDPCEYADWIRANRDRLNEAVDLARAAGLPQDETYAFLRAMYVNERVPS